MSDEDDLHVAVVMDEHELTPIVKEDGQGKPYIMLEPDHVCLRFRGEATIEEAQKAAKYLRQTFNISTPISYRPLPPPQGPEGLDHGPVN